MTLDALRKYLISIQGGGVDSPQLNQLAEVAIEGGYGAVWGAKEWKIRRAYTEAKSTTANQRYTSLPDDIELITSLVLIDGYSSVSIDIKDENAFDYDIPNPSGVPGSRPSVAKVVFDPHGSPGDKWRAYWFPIPSATYVLHLAYNRRADINDLASLPSYMLDAVIEACFVKMQRTPDARAYNYNIFEKTLERADLSDKTVGGYSPRLGPDPGFDDFANTSRGGSIWDPRSG